MSFLFTGKGGSGSWIIRGQQLGNALGAMVVPMADGRYCQAADLIVCVKRTPDPLIRAIRASGRPWLLDVVDGWQQPAGNGWEQGQCRGWLADRLDSLKPTGAIYATHAMQDDAGGFPGFVLPHHGRPGQKVNPIREKVATVAYEGREQYLGPWRAVLERACESRGWRFAVNLPELTDADIVVAFRGGQWDGYACRQWKSNVKLANAQITGTPFVGLPEAGYMKTGSGVEYFVQTAGQLSMAFDWLESQETRRLVSKRMLDKAYTVEKAAREFRCAAKSFYSRG